MMDDAKELSADVVIEVVLSANAHKMFLLAYCEKNKTKHKLQHLQMWTPTPQV